MHRTRTTLHLVGTIDASSHRPLSSFPSPYTFSSSHPHINPPPSYQHPTLQLFIVGSDAMVAFVGMMAWMPGVQLLSCLCPPGVEAMMFALLAGSANLGFGISRIMGAWLLKVTTLSASSLILSVSSLIPCVSSLIPSVLSLVPSVNTTRAYPPYRI